MHRRKFLGSSAVVVGVGAVAGCLDLEDEEDDVPDVEETPTPTPEDTPAETAEPVADPTITATTEGGGNFFDPVGLFVSAGETVTWQIEGGSHSTTAYHVDHPQSETTRIPEDAQRWDSEEMESNSEFEHTFEVEGTYDYFCVPHQVRGMNGRIVVGEPGGPAEESDNPDRELPDGAEILEAGTIAHDEFEE